MIRSKIKNLLEETVKKAGFEITDRWLVDYPSDPRYGDYFTNLPLLLAKKVKKKPTEIAGELVKQLDSHLVTKDLFRKIEVAGPGFINFYLSEKILGDHLKRIISYSKKWPNLTIGKGKTIVIDYSAPNIAKPFGIGHLRSTIIGQAVYNFYQFLGYKVIGDNHLGDWGTQFGKIIYSIKTWGNWNKIKKDPIQELEKLYVQFHREASENRRLEEEARIWFKKLEEDNREARRIWEKCVEWSLREFDRIYRLLGIKFDYQLGESFYQDKTAAMIEECKKKKIAEMSQGALVIFYPNGLTPGILIKSDGATTYLTRDLATLNYRLRRFKPTKIIYHVGNEQTLHFQQLFEAAKLLGWVKSFQLIHARHGLIRTKEGKFSTRLGRTINLEELIKLAIKKAAKIISQRGTRVQNRDKLAKIIGIGAIKYTDLSSNRKTDVIFDWKKMFALEGNSAPYLQYTYARSRSILRRAKLPKSFPVLLNDPLEKSVLRQLVHFEETVEKATEEQLPNLLADYLYSLASEFNTFYNKLPVLKAAKDLKSARLALVEAVGLVVKKGLELLGIEAPEKM